MPRKWVKEELRKDKFSSLVARFLEWGLNNKENLLFIGIAVIGAIVFIPLIVNRYKSINETAYMQLAQAEAAYFKGDKHKALDFIATAKKDNRTKAYPFALFLEADISLQSKNFKKAINIYKNMLVKYKKKKFTPQILINLAMSYEENKEYENAQKIYQQFIDKFPFHFLLSEAYLGLARVYESRGEVSKAKEVYNRIKQFAYLPSSVRDKVEKKLTFMSSFRKKSP